MPTILLRAFIKIISQPHTAIGAVLIVILGYMIVVPVLSLVWDASSFHTMDTFKLKGATAGEFTLYHWNRVYGNSSILNITVSENHPDRSRYDGRDCNHWHHTGVASYPD